jgi:predicted membrane-bound mannosyltransferase
MGYSLDSQPKVQITGNTTLTGLSNGAHNLTVYAQDVAGNMGVSETVYFRVEIPFPITPVAVASAATVAVVGAVLAFYFKKRKYQTTKCLFTFAFYVNLG